MEERREPLKTLSARRKDPETAPALYPVRFEVVVVHGEDRRPQLPLRQPDQRGIGEVHGSIALGGHPKPAINGQLKTGHSL